MLAPLRPLWTALALGLAQAAGPEQQPAEGDAGKATASEPGSTSTPTSTPGSTSTPTSTPDSTSTPSSTSTPTSQPTPTPAETATSGSERAREGEKEDNWVDVGHAFIEHRIFAPVLRLDRFFSDERDLDAERSRSFLRWRNEVHFTEDASRPIFATGVRANLRLPGLNEQLRRLRVVISSDTRDALQSLFARRPGSTNPEDEDTLGTGNAGLRLYFLDTLLSHADLGAGVLTRLPPGLFGQVRFRIAVPVGKLFLTRAVATGFWRTDTRFGTSEGLELEHVISRILVSRLTGTGTVTELSQGVEWGSELGLFAYIDPHSAAQLALAVNGASSPHLASDGVTRPPDLDRFRLYTRVRRDLYRRWIFVEVEPELAWPWTLEKRRHSAWGVTFRVELQFQGNEAPPPPPPAPPPEPEDPPPADALPTRPPPR